ncbi:unnamed protein product [Miscanthus lutarioriparius]|uniref:Protein kinase domain-containing protein n=1 Tax=Miscanthus lutarioriparius TaxID=422564 RepID=A0A811SEE8_9POAL|nr:unnamed protein product [Miscanthus lutarioriparius]
MDGRRRGGGGAAAGAVGWLLLLLLASLCARSRGLNADGVLLMAFKNAVTADPLGALAGWTYSDAAPCAWNGVVCNGFPQPNAGPAAVNVTSASADGNGNSAPAPAPAPAPNATAAAGGLGASLAAATVSRVISLVLPIAQLSGTLPPDLGRVEHLRHLDLSGNSLSGGLPATLLNATELRVLSLAGNAISGELPDTGAVAYLPIGGLETLELVDLSGNGFNGSLPSDFGGARLRLLNVSSNKLAGAVPTELAALVPANATVDMSRNNFTGAIPQDGPFAAQPAAAYEGNLNLCGPPLKQACSIPSSLSNPPNATDSPPAFAAIPKNPARAPPGAQGQPPSGQDKLHPAAIVAIVVGDIAGVGLLFMLFMYAYHVRKKRRQRREQDATPPLQQKSTRGIDGGVKTLDIAGGKEERASTSTGCCIGRRNDGSDSSEYSASSDGESDDEEDLKKRGGSFIGRSTPQEHGGSKKHNLPQQQAPPAPATLVTVDSDGGELEMETLLKASAYILGATGSSIVYKAVLANGTALAVRRIGESDGAEKLKDFEAQVRAVARFRHPNILRLRGFYWGADEKLLIHDYAPNGSLANIAFSRRFGSSSPLHLSLEARLRIARGVARGLAYIHEKKGVHGNLKPSNILLGADMEPWIGDLGLDRLLSGEAASHYRAGASARLFGSKRSMHSTSSLPDLSQMPGPGASPCGSASAAAAAAASSSSAPAPYQAPECLKNLRPTAKWDVYAFGMVLLELLSGRVYSEVELCQWHAGLVAAEEHGRVLRMADPTLRGEADGREDALLACFRLAFACCAMAPGMRPSMRDAVMVLERTAAAAAPGAAASSSGAAVP